jgi:hypothetical protein
MVNEDHADAPIYPNQGPIKFAKCLKTLAAFRNLLGNPKDPSPIGNKERHNLKAYQDGKCPHGKLPRLPVRSKSNVVDEKQAGCGLNSHDEGKFSEGS